MIGQEFRYSLSKTFFKYDFEISAKFSFDKLEWNELPNWL